MTTLTIELKKEFVEVNEDGTINWIPALKAAALEIQQLDALADPETSFPRPIGSNPDSEQPEGFIGAVNTPPTGDGMVTVRIESYEWINVALIPAMPTTFNFILGIPPHAGTIA